MMSDREFESELLEAAQNVTEAEIKDARAALESLLNNKTPSLSAIQIEKIRPSIFTIFAYLLACRRDAGVLTGVRRHEYISNLVAALESLEQWDENNFAPAAHAYGDLETVEFLYQEDSEFDEENVPGFSELRLVGNFLSFISIRRPNL